MSSEIRDREGTRYVTELLPGETWFYTPNGDIAIVHPERPPVIIGGAALNWDIVGDEITFTRAGDRGTLRKIFVHKADGD